MGGTANPKETAATGNIWLDSILWGTQWSSGGGGTTVVSAYIAGQNGTEIVKDGLGSFVIANKPLDAESAAMTQAMAAFEAVCGLDFRMVGSQDEADLVWSVVDGYDALGAYGWSTPPGLAEVGGEPRSLAAINYQAFDPSTGPELLAKGGFDFSTLLHELGHTMGLAHPHDHGGGSSVFPGVSWTFGDLGRYDMNQGVYTMMSYNAGWQTGPDGPSPSQIYGHQAGPMAFDIAALQHMYGANMAHRAGGDVYRLPGANGAGTYYLCLWDAGGTDRIDGAADRANLIDLRAATLADAPGGGGWLSYADRVHGGFTIAHGVVIENAKGGSEDDHLRGNDAANRLTGLGGEDGLNGGRGADLLKGGGDDDNLTGGLGDDRLTGGSGSDRLAGGAGADAFVFGVAGHSAGDEARDRIAGFDRGEDVIDLSGIDADRERGGDQHFRLDHGGDFTAGEIRQTVQGHDLLLEMNLDGDAGAEMSILILGDTHRLHASDFEL